MNIPARRRMYRFSIGIAAIVASAAGCYAQSPSWFNKVQFFAEWPTGFYIGSGPQEATAAPFTGQPIGFSPKQGDESQEKREIAAWHGLGRLYFVGAMMYPLASLPKTALAPCVDVYGTPMFFSDPTTSGPAAHSSLNPEYQQFLKSMVKQAIDDGADGLQWGNVPGPGAMTTQSGGQAGCFDATTMAGFRAFLSNKYSAADLKSRFAISDPSQFDYQQWIVQHGTQTTWNRLPLSGLAREFFWFQFSSDLAFIKQMSDYARQYALQSQGRIVTVGMGANDEGWDFQALSDGADFIWGESFYFSTKIWPPFANVFIKTQKGIRQWPVIVAAEPMWTDPAYTRLPKSTVNMVRLVVADTYSTGGIVSIPGKFLEMNAPERWIAYDPSVLKRYAQFVLGQPALFENLQVPAGLAILNSTPSRTAGTFDLVVTPELGPANNRGDGHYDGTARMLIDGNTQWESVLAPDTANSTAPSFTLSQLQKYSVLVLPDTFELDDAQANTILDFVRGGGVVVATGVVGTHQPGGQLAARPELQAMQAVEGATSYGKGVFVHTSKDLGWQYQQADMAGDDKKKSSLLQTFQELISPYLSADVVTSPVTHVYRSGGATAFLYRSASSAFILHLVNYDYDAFSDRYATKDNVQVTLRVGSQPVAEVVLRSPDIPGPQVLPFSRSGDAISFTVPHLEAWVVLSVQPNAAAPVIQSALPAPTVGAAGGTTVTFSVQAQDGDSNPLTYTWTVNGQVITDAFGPQYAYRVPQSASGGTYIVAVSVTDGSRTTQTSWTVTAPGFHSPRVLFDESHDEKYTLDPVKGSLVDPTNPPWTLYNYTDLAKWTQAESFSITRFSNGPITATALSGFDTLILASPRQAFTSAEMQAIWTFVKNGGGVVFLGGHRTSPGGQPAGNDLMVPFGLQLDDRAILSADSGSSGGKVDVTSWVSHPALDRVLDFQSTPQPALDIVFGGSFSVAAPAVALGRTSASAWRGTISPEVVTSPGAGLGPFVIVAASQLGSGRAFAISSPDALQLDPLGSPNQSVFLSGLTWVSANANPAPSVKAATPPKVSQIANGANYTPAISPGSWVTIFGENLANTPAAGQTWTSSDFQGNQLPTTLAGTSVRINGRPAAISFASPTQLNVQAPDDLAEGQVAVEVSTPSGIARGAASLAMLAPAAFQLAGKGITYAAAVSTTGVLIAHAADYAGARAAQPGEAISVFGTGFGPASPSQPAGQLVQAAPLAAVVTATVCGIPAVVTWAGLVGPGLDQINLTVPSSGATGDCSVRFSIGGKTTPAVSIPVQ